MILLLVILFWLAVFGYIPYHYRDTSPVRSFACGFCALWLFIITKEEPEERHDLHEGAASCGVGAGIASVCLLFITLVGLAIYTIIWAA